MGEERGVPYFSIATMVFLGAIGFLILEKTLAVRVFWAALICGLFKIIFLDLEVYSRIFQTQVDLLLVILTLNVRKSIYAAFLPFYKQ